MKVFLAIVGFVFLVSACQTDRARYNITPAEKIDPPIGMFPDGANEKSWAGSIVSYNLKSNKETVLKNPAEIMNTLAYFEWLSNDLKNQFNIPPYKLKKLLDARDKFRELIKMNANTTAQAAVNDYMALSQVLKITGSTKPEEIEEIAARRLSLNALKSKIDKAIKAIQEKQTPTSSPS